MEKAVVVITGGPGFGKTQIIEKLAESGFWIGGEHARDLMNEQVKNGGDLLPWKNIKAFQQEVLKRRVCFYNSVEPGELAFSDRGIPDQLAFARYRGFSDHEILLKKAKKYRYFPLVFITSPWKDIYQQDEVRKESFVEACRIHDVVCETYEDLGYQLVDLPKDSIEERVTFITNHITKLNDEFIKKKFF